MGNFIMNHYYEITAVILFGIGFISLLLHSNLIKKIVGLNIMDTAIYLFLASRGFIHGRVAPALCLRASWFRSVLRRFRSL